MKLATAKESRILGAGSHILPFSQGSLRKTTIDDGMRWVSHAVKRRENRFPPAPTGGAKYRAGGSPLTQTQKLLHRIADSAENPYQASCPYTPN